MDRPSPREKNARLPLPYPQTRRTDQVDTYQNRDGEVKIPDPYNWIEQEPYERISWLDKQGELTQAFSEVLDSRARIKAELTKNWDYSRFSYPRLEKDGRWYWNYNSGLSAQYVLFRSKSSEMPKFDVDGDEGPEAQAEVFFDPNLLAEDGFAYLATSSFSRDGRYFAYGVSLSGSDCYTICVRESSKPFNKCPEGGYLNDHDRLPDVIRFVKFSTMVWTQDSKGFFYQRFPERPEHGSAAEDKAGTEMTSDENAAICYHVLGTDQSQDILVYKDDQNPSWLFGIRISESEGQFIELSISKDTSHRNKLYMAELGTDGDVTSKLGNLKWHKIVDNWDAEYSVVSNHNRKHYVITDKDAPSKKVVTFDMPEGDPTENPEPIKLEEFIPEDKHGGTLSSMSPVNGRSFVAQYCRNAWDELYFVSSTGQFTRLSDPNFVGSISAFPSQHHDTFFATFSGFYNTSFTKRFLCKETVICPQNASRSGSKKPGDLGPMEAETLLVDSDPGSDLESLVFFISPVAVSINGNFGDVFEGTHKTLGKVALKRPRVSGTGYDGDVVRRFEREAATWRRLRHPHILECIGTMNRDGHMYIVSPFMDNGTLLEYVAREPKADKVRLLCQTADAIKYLHTEAVVHGDIKAGNILMSKQGFALLCDFGLTKMMDARTSVGMKGAGSMRWMSPELWKNAPKSFESDVYAFGMTIAEVLSGKEPFPHLSNPMAFMVAVMMENERPLREPMSSLDGLSYQGAWDIAAACWQVKPSDRIAMVEVFDRLSKELQEKGRERTWSY